MPLASPVRALAAALLLSLSAASAAPAQPAPIPAPTPAAAPAPPPSPVGGIRNKISADDLLSAESILEVHRERHGEDGPWLLGWAWLTRGALLTGEHDKARDYARDLYAECSRRVAAGGSLHEDGDLRYALGAVIEVEAQRIERTNGRRRAAGYVRSQLAKWDAPVSFRSRLNKRIDLLTLEGEAAPALVVEDHLGEPPPALAELRGKPVVLYVWDKGCGDCRAQAPALNRAMEKFGDRVELVALTRYYDTGEERLTEKARADSAWQAQHAALGGTPVVLSTASMERYGGSSTPTFVFVDRKGVVRRYTPTRLTQQELERSVRALLD